MDRIEYVSGPGSNTDCLDGVPIADGDRLLVCFPDGDTRVVTAYVTETRGSYLHDGQVYPTTQLRAHCRAEVHGVKALVPLVGLEAGRVA